MRTSIILKCHLLQQLSVKQAYPVPLDPLQIRRCEQGLSACCLFLQLQQLEQFEFYFPFLSPNGGCRFYLLAHFFLVSLIHLSILMNEESIGDLIYPLFHRLLLQVVRSLQNRFCFPKLKSFFRNHLSLLFQQVRHLFQPYYSFYGELKLSKSLWVSLLICSLDLESGHLPICANS